MAVERSAFVASFSQMRADAERLGWGDIQMKGNAALAVGSILMFNARLAPAADALRTALQSVADRQQSPTEVDISVAAKHTGPQIMGWQVVRLQYIGGWDLMTASDFTQVLRAHGAAPLSAA